MSLIPDDNNQNAKHKLNKVDETKEIDPEEQAEEQVEEEAWKRNNEINFNFYSLTELKEIINRCKIRLKFGKNENPNDIFALRRKLRAFTRDHHLMVLTPQQVHNKLKSVLKVKNVERLSIYIQRKPKKQKNNNQIIFF